MAPLRAVPVRLTAIGGALTICSATDKSPRLFVSPQLASTPRAVVSVSSMAICCPLTIFTGVRRLSILKATIRLVPAPRGTVELTPKEVKSVPFVVKPTVAVTLAVSLRSGLLRKIANVSITKSTLLPKVPDGAKICGKPLPADNPV